MSCSIISANATCRVWPSFILLVPLSALLYDAIFPSGFMTPEAWTKVVVLSDAGKELVDSFSEEQFNRPDLVLAAFLAFFHRSLLIDEVNTSAVEIVKTVDPMIREGQIRLPLQWGRCLYDKFNASSFSGPVESLTPAETEYLLEDTPQGVLQYGSLLAGPLGILTSNEFRYLRRSPFLPLAL
jgi:hypothetical protein